MTIRSKIKNASCRRNRNLNRNLNRICPISDTNGCANCCKRAIGEAIRREFHVSDVGLITVNDVDVGGDLKSAVAFISILGNAEPAETRAAGAGRTPHPHPRAWSPNPWF